MTLIKNIVRAIMIFNEEKNIVPGQETIRILPTFIYFLFLSILLGIGFCRGVLFLGS